MNRKNARRTPTKPTTSLADIREQRCNLYKLRAQMLGAVTGLFGLTSVMVAIFGGGDAGHGCGFSSLLQLRSSLHHHQTNRITAATLTMPKEESLLITTTTTTPTSTAKRATSIHLFIDSITASGRKLQYPSNVSAEERALRWLLDDDLGTNESNLLSLRQRYSLAALWFQTPAGFDAASSVDHAATWVTNTTECAWRSVGCDSAGRVNGLYLYGDGVKGHIPNDLGLLNALTALDLGSNELTGALPSSLGLLTALTSVDLDDNMFTGTIPSTLGWLTALTYLHLENNALTGTIPSVFGSLAALTSLFLYNNVLTGVMPFDCMNRPSFEHLIADCGEVSCPCCTHCCTVSQDGIPAYDNCEV
jgi:Leucine rich repeat